jgi:hypothetical protein
LGTGTPTSYSPIDDLGKISARIRAGSASIGWPRQQRARERDTQPASVLLMLEGWERGAFVDGDIREGG